jgi:hypothetical protein
MAGAQIRVFKSAYAPAIKQLEKGTNHL